jgi:mono/diheme cytochrome c family protein
MKKVFIIGAVAAMITTIACTDVKREPSRVYMPDMAYSRAYETYITRDTTQFTTDQNDWESADGNVKIFYNNQPVAGTVARGESYVYHLPKDKIGDTTYYVQSAQTQNPIPMPDSIRMVEVERLYLINCAICHGPKLDGNGPLYKGGEGPYPAKPANLSGTDAKYVQMTEGTMFYSITYGRNLMGSYASQVTPKQRWEIVHYIKSFQAKASAGAVPAPVGGAAAQSSPNANNVDSTSGKKMTDQSARSSQATSSDVKKPASTNPDQEPRNIQQQK